MPSWSSDGFPDPKDLETQVEFGRNAEIMKVEDWDRRGQYGAVVDTIKKVVNKNDGMVYIVDEQGGRYEVFILVRLEDGLFGVKSKGVAT